MAEGDGFTIPGTEKDDFQGRKKRERGSGGRYLPIFNLN